MSRTRPSTPPYQRRSDAPQQPKPAGAAWLRGLGWLARFSSSASSGSSVSARSSTNESDTVFLGPATLDPRGTAGATGSAISRPVSSASASDELAWAGLPQGAGWRAAFCGAWLGVLVAAVLWWPARWLPDLSLPGSVPGGTGPGWILRPTSGTWWQGQAMLLQTGAVAFQPALARPVTVSWDIRPTWGAGGPGMKLRLAPGCCGRSALQAVVLRHQGAWWVQVRDGSTRWPLEWLAPMGVPVQALQLSGELWLDTAGLSWRSGHAFSGEAVAQAVVHSNLTPGAGMSAHYQARLRPSPAAGAVALGGADGFMAKPAVLELRTLGGALQLNGEGEQTEQGWRFRGTAQASGEASALRSIIEAALPPGKPSVFSWGKAS